MPTIQAGGLCTAIFCTTSTQACSRLFATAEPIVATSTLLFIPQDATDDDALALSRPSNACRRVASRPALTSPSSSASATGRAGRRSAPPRSRRGPADHRSSPGRRTRPAARRPRLPPPGRDARTLPTAEDPRRSRQVVGAGGRNRSAEDWRNEPCPVVARSRSMTLSPRSCAKSHSPSGSTVCILSSMRQSHRPHCGTGNKCKNHEQPHSKY